MDSKDFLTLFDFVKLCLNFFDFVQITQLCTNVVLFYNESDRRNLSKRIWLKHIYTFSSVFGPFTMKIYLFKARAICTPFGLDDDLG